MPDRTKETTEATQEKSIPQDCRRIIELYKGVLDILRFRDSLEVKNMYNNYCKKYGEECDMIREMDEFDNVVEGLSPLTIIKSIDLAVFDPDQDYFKQSPYGYRSGNDPEELIDLDDLAIDIVSTKDSLGCNRIKDLPGWEEADK